MPFLPSASLSFAFSSAIPFGSPPFGVPFAIDKLSRTENLCESALKALSSLCVETMLVELETEAHWKQALRETTRTPDLIYFHFSIRQELEGKFPESPIRVFAYPVQGPKRYWFMCKDNLFIDPYCMIAHSPRTAFHAGEFMECLREFRVRAFGALNSNRPHLMTGKERLVKVYATLMRNVTSDLISGDDLCMNLFYMTEDQKKLTMKEQPVVPPGYELSDIDAFADAELVNSTWKFAKAGDLEQTTAKLARLPSACVRFEGQPVAFEMCDPAGFYNNLFVFENHRRKGLGTAVELSLSHKCIQARMTPYKTVDKNNKVVVDLSMQSPLWTRWEEEGTPVTIVFQTWTVPTNAV